MIPVDFEGSNTDMLKPQNMTEEECSNLRVRFVKNNRGPQFTSRWQPSYEDLKALEAGKPLCLEMYIDASIFVNIDTKLQAYPPLIAENQAVVWVPGDHELIDLRNGTGIYITFLCDRFPVISVYVGE